MDLNRDGIDDLAVSAPSANGLDLEYRGRVYVFFGNKGSGLSRTADLEIQPSVFQPAHRAGQQWNNRFIAFGEQLHGIDFDDDGFVDLLITSNHASPLPGRHQVCDQIDLTFVSLVRFTRTWPAPDTLALKHSHKATGPYQDKRITSILDLRLHLLLVRFILELQDTDKTRLKI